jgi:amino acid adenylation domain-containing protein
MAKVTQVNGLDAMNELELQLLGVCNYTEAEYPQEQCIHQLFEAQVQRTPDAIAVVFGEEHLSYQDLNKYANQLAHFLRAHGVKPGSLVGVCLHRSMSMIAALLGILKAGGAYVPLSPEFPKERLAYILEDTQIRLLLTQRHLLEVLPNYKGDFIFFDDHNHDFAGYEECNPESLTVPTDLAYIMYTSGTTGNPKGVMISHQGVVNYLIFLINTYNISSTDTVIQIAAISFDPSVREIFGPLVAGAKVLVLKHQEVKNPVALVSAIQKYHVTCILSIIPTMLRALIQQIQDHDQSVDSLRIVLVCGEALHLSDCEKALAVFNENTSLVNQYGPTECTMTQSYYYVNRSSIIQSNSHIAPIGKSIPNTQIYILNDQLGLVPIGEPGEIYISGVGLARGYLNRPDLTAERFIPNPFSTVSGSRLYRTGDLGRYLADGNLEYLGRVDNQVKINGIRVELAEIEAVLSQHPCVQSTVVLLREDRPGDKRLVAYAVFYEQQTASIPELRSFLIQKLPLYMVPSIFVILDSMPLTPTGKINRHQLPLPAQNRSELSNVFVAPRTELEVFIANLWQEILDIKEIGIYDNFFELGGDSIKGLFFINKLQKTIQKNIHIVLLFDAPCVADFSNILKKNYPETVKKLWNNDEVFDDTFNSFNYQQNDRVDERKVLQLRQLIKPLAPHETASEDESTKNPQAIFILCPPRSGSTLFRVMLGGHPRLFAPPATDLLSFNNLLERKKAFSGRDRFWLEGTIRAIMEIKKCDVEEAKFTMEDCENKNLTTKQFYRLLQEWIGDRIFVEKTARNSMDIERIKRAETDFKDALYIHLLRHPCGMINSFEEARLDQIIFDEEHSFSVRQLGELFWLISHQNILEFLINIPTHRHYCVKFEDVVKQPKPTMEGVCQFLGLEFHPDMINPYRGNRMTDGIYDNSRMIGDIKFHQHKSLNPEVADKWQTSFVDYVLGDITQELAASFGYD